MVYWNAEEIQEQGFPPGARHSDRWRNLDIPVWPRNKAPVIGLGLSRWARPNQSQEAKATFFSTSDHLATVVLEDQRTVTGKWYTEVCLPSILKNSGEPAKGRTARNSAPPWKCLFPYSHCNNCVSGKDADEINDSSSLQSRPGPVLHFPVPEREESHARFPGPEDAVAAYNEELSAMSEN